MLGVLVGLEVALGLGLGVGVEMEGWVEGWVGVVYTGRTEGYCYIMGGPAEKRRMRTWLWRLRQVLVKKRSGGGNTNTPADIPSHATHPLTQHTLS